MMKSILLIDDEDINLFILQNLLRLSKIDADIVFFNTSQKGINYLEDLIAKGAEFPDLILLDIEMPVMNGWDFLEVYKKFQKSYTYGSKVIIFTTSIVEQDMAKAKSYEEVEDFVNKPMTIELLKSIQQEHFVN
ncbi:response regulator [Fulvivirgaceae bacterium BMA12]|uniref:Response regulator n=1 Tax=Agaribacillus aureus TaxID=3051825 RepID=A0ABT8LIT7_9BACT|nr:response regulator [Fulvivirgaceae bacterium BMA12]